MGVGASLYMYDVVVKKFTFATSSPDEFLQAPTSDIKDKNSAAAEMGDRGHNKQTWAEKTGCCCAPFAGGELRPRLM